MKKITAAQLRRAGACTKGLAKFEAAFPHGVIPTMMLAECLARTLSARYVGLLLKGKYDRAYHAAWRKAAQTRDGLDDAQFKELQSARSALLDKLLSPMPMSHEVYAKEEFAMRSRYFSRTGENQRDFEVACARAAVRQWQRQNGQVIQ